MRALLCLALLLVSASTRAADSVRPVNLLLGVGSELRPEKDVNGDENSHVLKNYFIGTGYQSFVVLLEHASFDESSGNSSLSVKRNLEDTMLWVYDRPLVWNHLVPIYGAGLGAYQEKITTSLAGAPDAENESAHKLLGGGSFGIATDFPFVWISLEARILFGDELDRQPTLGGLLRAGLTF